MDYFIMNKFLAKKSKVRLRDLKDTITALKEESRRKRGNEPTEYYPFYDGQINAYCLCLDLIENFEKRCEVK